ncbi:hypothetical protein E1091_15905 [Micromonospora fluostatini]|uniref:SMI1/KNR4 family protein n=1 Tax=Micromonospora fluostatini TaxID=1629071 RepID=A0ABY2DEA8_9ACTN|nr:hypothetical protein E1091_15905 [Micromonospora fluostatini]
MAAYKDLTRLLPQSVPVAGLMELAREFNISLSHEPPVEPFHQDGREWERFSVYHLLLGLDSVPMAAEFADSNSRDLIADDHWQEYARTQAEDLGEVAHVAPYVDWKRYASDVRGDYSEVVIDSGEFAGTWWVRG